MNRVIMQLWEESERGWGIRPDGCSLHINSDERIKYIDSIYIKRKNENTIPNEYERIVGNEIEAFIEDNLFNKVKLKKNIRVIESDLNNLINLEEIIIKKND